VSIGETLAQARGRAGLTVTNVSERTRIRETIIRAIEQDDYSSCGGDFYARGHIRSIAHVVGTDPEPLIWEYDQARGGPPETTITAADAFEPIMPVHARSHQRARPPHPRAHPQRPGADPQEPGTDPQEPGTDPQEPGTDPQRPGAGLQHPGGGPQQSPAHAQQPEPPPPPGPQARPRLPRVRPAMPRGLRRLQGGNWTVVLTVVAVLAAMTVYLLIFGTSHIPASQQAASTPPPGGHHPSPAANPTQRTPARHTPTPATSPSASHHASTPPAAPVQTLIPASAVAFGPGGTGHGDNPGLAGRAIDGNSHTAWHTDWYATATFGNLQPGTGLLLDLGHPVTVTTAQIALGGGTGAGLELRAGNAATLGQLSTVARASGAGGTVILRPSSPVPGRYLLIWFTRLPQDPSGTFQVQVSGVRLSGRS
jgi:Helix-turn-helix domain